MRSMCKKIKRSLLLVAVTLGLTVAAAYLPAAPVSAKPFEGGVKSGMKATKMNKDGSDDPKLDINGLIENVVKTLLFIVGVLSVIMIIVSGIQYITSAGDSAKTNKATQGLIYSIAGLIIAIMAYAITYFVFDNLTNPSKDTKDSANGSQTSLSAEVPNQHDANIMASVRILK